MQGHVLEGELAVTAEEEGKNLEQVEQESDDRVGIVSGAELRGQRLGRRQILGEGQDRRDQPFPGYRATRVDPIDTLRAE